PPLPKGISPEWGEIALIFDQVGFSSKLLKFNMFFNFPEVNGKNGSLKTAKAEAICKATYITVLVRASSVFMVFHSSSSARYLFPRRATFIISPWALRKR